MERKRGAGREQVLGRIRARILAATRSAPPEGLSHWSSREMVKFIYIEHWNADAQPFAWTATTDEILAKVALTQTNIRQLVDNNAK